MIKKENCSLRSYHTFGMEVNAACFIEYASKEELQQLLSDGTLQDTPWLHIGGGSNLLFLGDYAGVVVHSAIKGMEVVQEDAHHVYVKVGAGEVWDDFVCYAVERNWYGAENLSIIPGEVGASAVQNIGAYGVEVADLITTVDTVEVATAHERTFTQAACTYGYRSSIFKTALKNRYIVTAVTFKLAKKSSFCLTYGHLERELSKRNRTLTLPHVRQTIIEVRNEKLPDPKEWGNAGSFFMNPVVGDAHFKLLQKEYPAMPHYLLEDGRVKIPAAWLIEQCGWKGAKVGNAGVYSKQPLVLINCGGATGKELLALATQIAESVEEQFGITITPEVNVIETTDEGHCIG